MKAPLVFILTITLYCCTPAKEESRETLSNQDTSAIIQTFIYGLWSMDSGNSLLNEGFYFRNDGTVDFVSSEITGNWRLKGNDSLNIDYTYWYDMHNLIFKIDSLNEGRMVLSDTNGFHVFRKIPFGLNPEGNVAGGYSGYIDPGQSKEFPIELPPAKKIAVMMACPDSSVTFRLYDDQTREITSADVRNWTGIVIRGGKYKIVLTKPLKSKWNEEADYDIKVMVY